MKTRTSLTLALLPLPFLTACRKGDPLPGGYAIFFADGDDVGLVRPPAGEILIGPTLVRIGNSGALIFGEVQAKAGRAGAESETSGFFILDSTTGTIERGLSREDWMKKLQKAGLQGEPELAYPERKGPRFN
ncbi:MAG: hypothetical protein ACYC6N_07215 [Pirellulaceae bacterium]